MAPANRSNGSAISSDSSIIAPAAAGQTVGEDHSMQISTAHAPQPGEGSAGSTTASSTMPEPSASALSEQPSDRRTNPDNYQPSTTIFPKR